LLSGLTRHGVCNVHRLERYGHKSRQRTNRARTWRMWPPQTSRAIWRLQVEPLVKHHKRGSIGSSRWISGSDLPALVRGLTFTVEAGAARPNRRTAHRS
jgi:hypothetical protein